MSLASQFAAQCGWTLARANVIVEGTLDETLLAHASSLYSQAKGRQVLDSDFAVFAAGRGEDGGVDGVSRTLITMRQMAEVDSFSTGTPQNRFAGLFDNDYAGRTSFGAMHILDHRIQRYTDIFLLHPIMPSIGDGILDRQLEVTKSNLPFNGMDWEIEDLCSERLLLQFEAINPNAIQRRDTRSSRIHREIARKAKGDLVRYFVQSAKFEDVKEFIILIKLMRGYLNAPHDFIDI